MMRWPDNEEGAVAFAVIELTELLNRIQFTPKFAKKEAQNKPNDDRVEQSFEDI